MQLFSELFGIKPLSAALTFVQVNQANTANAQGSAKVTSGHGLDNALQGISSDVTLADDKKKRQARGVRARRKLLKVIILIYPLPDGAKG